MTKRRIKNIALCVLAALASGLLLFWLLSPRTWLSDYPISALASQGNIFASIQTKVNAAGEPPGGGMYAIDPSTGRWSKVVDGLPTSIRVSPDSNSVAFTDDAGLWLYNRSQAEPEKIGDGKGVPVWSPDSKSLIQSERVIANDTSTFTHQKFDIESKRWQSAPGFPSNAAVRDLSSDGRLHALVVMDEEGAPNVHIQLGPGKTQVLVLEGTSFAPRFSPDGSKVSFVRHVHGQQRIAVYNIAKGELEYDKLLIDAIACWNNENELFIAHRKESRVEIGTISLSNNGELGQTKFPKSITILALDR